MIVTKKCTNQLRKKSTLKELCSDSIEEYGAFYVHTDQDICEHISKSTNASRCIMHIYCLPILLPWDETDSQLLRLVSPQRQNKIQNYVFETDRKLSLYSALLARLRLSSVSGIPALDLVFGINTSQKPVSLSTPNIHFNLSHTRGFVLCGICAYSTIGVDVEKITIAPIEIMKRFFHPEEIQYVENAPALERDLRFYKIWTRKEAYTKQLGTGLNSDVSAYNTLSSNLSSILYTWRHGNYICSACSKSPNSIEIKYVSESDIRNYFVALYDKK